MTNEAYFLISALLLLAALEVFLVWRRRRKLTKRDLSLVSKEWESIRSKIEKEPKHALIEADKLLDFVLKKRGFHGSLSEKLKTAEKFFSNIDDVWTAHKLRNRAVHEIGFDVMEQEIRKALSSYKKALWDLGVKL